MKIMAFYGLAESLARLSRCGRLRVGCVVVTSDMREVVAVGYNGPPAGVDNDACREGEGACGCVHAEANALVKLATRERGLTLMTTTSPCEHCAGLTVNSGKVSVVIYGGAYRDLSGLELLTNAGVSVRGMT